MRFTNLNELFRDYEPEAVIPKIEEWIKQEKLTREANILLGNTTEFLISDIRITEAEILLAILRGRCDS
jgi:hypothetical protein